MISLYLFLFLLQLVNSHIYVKNIALGWHTTKDILTVELCSKGKNFNKSLKQKGLNGFQILCFSNSQNMTQNLTCYTSQVKSFSLSASQLVGNSTNLQEKRTEENSLLVNVKDENEYPIPTSPNFLKVSFILNSTNFQKQFSLVGNSSNIWIYAGYNSKYQLNSISKLINDYDESFISKIDIGTPGEKQNKFSNVF
jgi:hypothetical protein